MAVIAVIVAVMADRVTNTGRRYATLYRAASDRLLTAQEDERKRLAADLHDGVGQTMTALALTLDAADATLARTGAPDAAGREGVRRAREMAGIALEDVRGVAFRLRPARLRETGLVAGLRELAASAGRPVEFSADASLVRPNLLDEDREVDTYRIVQEALGNATRHGQADRIRITIQRVDRMLRIEIVDDGVGFDTAIISRRGLGLASMRDRASVVAWHAAGAFATRDGHRRSSRHSAWPRGARLARQRAGPARAGAVADAAMNVPARPRSMPTERRAPGDARDPCRPRRRPSPGARGPALRAGGAARDRGDRRGGQPRSRRSPSSRRSSPTWCSSTSPTPTQTGSPSCGS